MVLRWLRAHACGGPESSPQDSHWMAQSLTAPAPEDPTGSFGTACTWWAYELGQILNKQLLESKNVVYTINVMLLVIKPEFEYKHAHMHTHVCTCRANYQQPIVSRTDLYQPCMQTLTLIPKASFPNPSTNQAKIPKA